MTAPGELHGPIDERLLDVRTHATVADIGSFVPSDLYLVEAGANTPTQLTSGAWSDRSPAWSPAGARP